MRYHKLEILFGALTIFVSLALPAEESGNVMQPLPKDQKEYYEKAQKLNSLTTRIVEAEKQFNHLVREKSVVKDPVEKQRILKQMVEVTKERNKAADEFNKIKSDLALRYPNQGEHLNRQYQTQSKKSVEELEGVAGLDELLTRTKKIIEKKYAPFEDPNEPPSHPQPKVALPEAEKPVRLKLEK